MKFTALCLVSLTVTALCSCQRETPAHGTETGNGTPPPSTSPHRPTPDATKPETLVGAPLKVAQETADKAGIKHRVVMEDGKPLPATMDYNPERLNFTVVQGVVTEVKKG